MKPLVTLLAVAGLFCPHPLPAQFTEHQAFRQGQPQPPLSVQAGFTLDNAAPSSPAFTAPTAMAIAQDGRIFVAEKAGIVWIIQNGARLSTPFLDIRNEVLSNNDRGLTGLTLDPNFGSNGYIYLAYCVDPNFDGADTEVSAFGRVSRFKVSASNPNIADPSSRLILLGASWSDGVPNPSGFHTIDALRFAPDGTLLISSGDGAHQIDPDAGGRDPDAFIPGHFQQAEDIGAFRSEWIGSLAGKILRIDPASGLGLPSNPFYTGNPSDKQSKVWVYGLRNPWRFTIRPGTGSSSPGDGNPGDLYIGDCGWWTWEEVDVAPARGGQNFGWPCNEGPYANSPYVAQTPSHAGCTTVGTPENPSSPTFPLVYWNHTDPSIGNPPGYTGSCSLGGVFYTGSSYPSSYQGSCFTSDFSDWIRVIHLSGNSVTSVDSFAANLGVAVDLVAHPVSGDIYLLSVFNGIVYHVSYQGSGANQPPQILSQPGAADMSAFDDSLYHFTIQASDPDPNDTLSLVPVSLPSWLTVSSGSAQEALQAPRSAARDAKGAAGVLPATGEQRGGAGPAASPPAAYAAWTLSGTPGPAHVGDALISVRVVDNAGHAATLSYWLRVYPGTFSLEGGWNTVSPPRYSPGSGGTTTVFPGASSPAFLYDGTYIRQDTLQFGVGYFLRYGAPQQIHIRGYLVRSNAVQLTTGWNLIGAISAPVATNQIVADPPGILATPFFGYAGAYTISSRLDPARGYWIKVRAPGKIILNEPPLGSLTGNAASPGEEPPGAELLSRMTFTGKGDGSPHQTVYFAGSGAQIQSPGSFELPPLSPEGSFDVRFAGDRSLALFSDLDAENGREEPLVAQIPGGSVDLSYRIQESGRLYYVLRERDGATITRDIPLAGQGELSLAMRDDRQYSLLLRQVPVSFTLFQNFPNPFNPETEIRFAVGSGAGSGEGGAAGAAAFVSLAVYDVLGSEVARIVNQELLPGVYTRTWSPKGIPSGIYFYRLRAGAYTETRKMLLVR